MSRSTDRDEEREARVKELMERARKHQQRTKSRETTPSTKAKPAKTKNAKRR